jgi:hypothetical protein
MSWSEEKYNELVSRLHAKHPLMFSQPYGGIAVGEGWYHIIESLCGNIDAHVKWKNELAEKHPEKYQPCPQVVVSQIKEKFGGLRFYYDGGDDQVYGMVRMAESWAAHSCEQCGDLGTRRSGGWIRTLCDEHEKEYQHKQAELDAN